MQLESCNGGVRYSCPDYQERLGFLSLFLPHLCALIPNLVADFLSISVFHPFNYFLNIQCVLIPLSLLSSLHHVIKPKSPRSSPHPRAGHQVPTK